ncbi:MAG TPA: tRNA (guanosine(37)-N1)-methyltransferase TrmD [Steroidobacteraceae bacterium]|nr:tRNA (guanosine(37)-N1)-methyltransferase TrmD [Steroidobacteraceae bacterium]HQX78258.1 tRNA (guanosine(37)-N1)-methyltransferase TrmD [Steroidobacteraceae bacterium]
MQIEVVTLFPDMIRQALGFGVLGRAIERGIVQIGTEDPRAHTRDAHRTVDDRPYGGGPGMVLKPGPMAAAIDAAAARAPRGAPRVYLSAQGERLEQALVTELAAFEGLVLIAGRYEGLDERVIATRVDREVSLGDFVLSGGEVPVLAVIDAVARLLPGVLGDERSSVEESFTDGLLDWPHYTRPVEFEGHEVPAVLQGGHHADIRRWRLKQAVARTWRRRPDLIAGGGLSREASALLNEFLEEQRHGQHHSTT